MRAYEHRSIGDDATGAALVNVGGDSDPERFTLTFGDVVALSGDYFRPGDEPPPTGASQHPGYRGDGSGRLFTLARVPGHAGRRVDTRDELVCALKVSTVDEAIDDPRFEPGGRFAHFEFSEGAQRSDVERRVRDRYLTLAANNDDHFAAPGRSDAPTGSGYGSALAAYRGLHEAALDEAWRLGSLGGDISRAMAREAAAQHYLTDAFASGHLRTPVAEIRRYWKARYPRFWEHLQRRVASETAAALRELSALLRIVPPRLLRDRTLTEVTKRTGSYPELSVGDLVARVFHDWDNVHGLAVEGGGTIFGDGHVDEGVGRQLALAAVRAGNDDVEVAFRLGRSGHLTPAQLYERVREATGADGDAFVAETTVPRPSTANPPQNWRAGDVETLWESPMVGTTGTTVGQALEAMLEPGEQFIRQLDGLGQGLAGTQGLLAVPLLGSWLGRRCCQAFHQGFVEPLSHDPHSVVAELVEGAGPPQAGGTIAPCAEATSSKSST